MLLLKSSQSQDVTWTENAAKGQICSSLGLIVVFCQTPVQKEYCFASNLSSSVCSHVGSFFGSEEQKKVGS